MKTLLDRIAEIANQEGISITKLEQTLGASQGVFSRALRNNTDIQAKWIEKIIENYPQYRIEWLITGKGDMIKPADNAKPQETATAEHIESGYSSEEVVSRLMHYLEQTGSNKSRFERQVGLSNGFISHMSSQITFAALAKIASGAPDLNLGWLFSGVGPMFITTEPVIPEGEQQARDHDNARHREIVDIQQLIDDLRQDKERLLKEKAELWEMYKSAIAAAK